MRCERTSPTIPTISTGVLALVTSSVLPMGFSFGKNFLRPRLADQTDVSASGDIVFVKVTPGDERNSPGLQDSPGAIS